MEVRPDFDIPLLIDWATIYLQENRITKPRLNAEYLLVHCTGRSRVDLYAYPEKPVSKIEKEAYTLAVQRRALREPLQYILGIKGFRYIELADRKSVV